MVDVAAIASAAVQNAGAPGAAAPAPPPPPEAAAPSEVARFDAALQGGTPQQGDAPPPDVQFEPVQDAAPIDAAASPGDSILRGLERMSSDFRGSVEDITKAVEGMKPGEMMNPADLMRMQMQFTQVTVQQDVTGKVVGKATQNLDTFLKNQ